MNFVGAFLDACLTNTTPTAECWFFKDAACPTNTTSRQTVGIIGRLSDQHDITANCWDYWTLLVRPT
ncbi:MAG: hypothetical protein GY817_03625 [bacterium]|nr:hypothetical protein [bacterium]